ncbi:MAG: putative addiction module antidote protein [Rhodospirillales bacterium]|nr:putative addiction module antidote protein [Rhodospirillales bacterium]
MPTIRTTVWDAADHLNTVEDIAAYLEAALEDGDPQLIIAALGDIARSAGMTKVAATAGLGRESLYKALSSQGNPAFATVLKVIQSLGLQLSVEPRKSRAG